jgi:hypothetical protein
MKNTRKRVKLVMWFALLTMVVMGTLLITPTPKAHAAGWESGFWQNDNTNPDVISDCNQDGDGITPGWCYYHVTDSWVQPGLWRQVSYTVNQCGERSAATYTVNWSTSVGTTYTWSNSFTVSVGLSGPLAEGVTAGLTDSSTVTNSWSTGQTVSTGGSVTLQVGANQMGWVEWQPVWLKTQGWLEVHYPQRVYGHYFWYYPYSGSSDLGITTPHQLPNGQADGNYRAVVVNC